ncbi:MAG: O-methyltransferase [Erysipelotrichaceae bacterium]|nr:O-methyltransferase [Erysipelotrichaceae bacterium]
MDKLELLEKTAKENHVPIMMKDGIEFLVHLVKERKPQQILELGTAIGYSAIQMARCNELIEIDTIELDFERGMQAIQNIKDEHLDYRVHVHLMNIDDFKSDKKYDLIFVDAAKAQYRRYTEMFMNNLSDDGIFVFDNLCFHGMVDDPSLIKSRQTRQLCRKIREFREWLLKEESFHCDFYSSIGDGVAVVSVKSE